MNRTLQRFDAWFDARGQMRGVCLFRVFAGPLVMAHLWPFWRAAVRGEYFRDGFYVPWFAHYPEPSLGQYTAVLTLGLLAAVALGLGWHARAASWVCFSVVAYNFFLSETFFHHNRAFLLTFLAGLALTHCGDSLSLDALRRKRGPAPTRDLWPLWLWRALACTPYLASSTSKLLDPAWFAGVVTMDRVERYRHRADWLVPHALLDLAANPMLHAVLAKLVIALELSIGIGLWFGRSRCLAMWLAVVFHTLIQLSADIQVFSLLGIAGLAIWTAPVTRDRRLQLRLDDPAARRLAFRVAKLDWLARFEVVPIDAGPAMISLSERGGGLWTGPPARVRVFARMPLTAFFALPLCGFGLGRAAAARGPAHSSGEQATRVAPSAGESD